MLEDEFPEAILRSVRRVGQLSGLPGRARRGLLCGGQRRGERLPSPLPLTTSCPSPSGAGTRGTAAAPGSASPSPARSTSAARGWGGGQGRSREEGGAGRPLAVPGISRCYRVSGERVRSAPRPRQPRQHRRRWTALAAPRGRRPERAFAAVAAAARRGRSRGTRAGGGCPDGVLCPQAQDLLPTGRGSSEEPRGRAREFLFPSPLLRRTLLCIS